jgi:hypothetical protein
MRTRGKIRVLAPGGASQQKGGDWKEREKRKIGK